MDKDKFLEQLESGKVGTDSQVSELEKSIAQHELTLNLQLEKNLIEEEINKIAAAKPRIIEPSHEFQKEDRYWELESILRLKSFEINKLNFEMQLEHLYKTIDAKKKELARLKGD